MVRFINDVKNLPNLPQDVTFLPHIENKYIVLQLTFIEKCRKFRIEYDKFEYFCTSRVYSLNTVWKHSLQ